MEIDVSREPWRVVLADDDPDVLMTLRFALEADGWSIVAEASTADEAVTLVSETQPDLVLLDINMPGGGIAAARAITDAHPAAAVVMMTASEDDADLFDALRAGVVGYLLKDTPPNRLGELLRGALAGEAALSPRVLGNLLDEFRGPPRSRLVRTSTTAARLSRREWEVMELLTQGLSTDEVARRLFLSSTTVRVHISTVVRKLRVPDREAALAVLREQSEN
jgi:DNA-binding NarL/FixJ family response regulator